MESDLINTGFDPNKRELCPDGACIGVIGRDGRCRECGTLSPSGPPAAVDGEKSPEEVAGDGADTRAGGMVEEAWKGREEKSTAPGVVEGDEFDPDRRQLCGDGACVGVIGADGRCKVCGGPPE